jgi:hypothetical protein
MRNYLSIAAIFFIAGYILNEEACEAKIPALNKKYDTVLNVIDTQYVQKDSIVYRKGKDIYHDTTIFVPRETKVIDTVEVLAECHAINIFKDSLQLPDSVGMVKVFDTVQDNRITGRRWDATVNKITITKEIILREKPRTTYHGAIMYNDEPIGAIIVQKPSKFGFILGAGANSFIVGMTFKIK